MKLYYIPIETVRKFIEDGCGDTDYIIWCLDKFEEGNYHPDDDDE